MNDFERAVEFVHGITRRSASTEVPSRFGAAYLNLEVPSVWSRNYLLATENVTEASADDLAAETDRIMGGALLRHRKVELTDDAAGERLEPGFRALGWASECDVIMVSRRDPDRPVETSIVDEVSLDDLVAAWTDGWRTDPAVLGDEVMRQLVENKRDLSAVVDTRFFAARVDGEVASYCELYSDGHIAQIENVLTLDRFRKRGLARATVSKALGEARKGGHDLIFLIADERDWPKELYGKLGFDEVGRIWEFVLPRAK